MENESSVAKPRGVLAKDIQSMNYMLLGHFSDSNTSGTFNKLNVSQVILSPPSVDLPLDSSWLHSPVTAVTWPLLSRDSYFQGLDSIFSCSLLGCGADRPSIVSSISRSSATLPQWRAWMRMWPAESSVPSASPTPAARRSP